MNLITTRTGPVALPPLERLVLHPNDLPGFRCIYADAQDDTNEAVARRAANPERTLRRLQQWGRLDGYAVRYVPAQAPADPSVPIVVDSSAARFSRGAGALQALTDESLQPDAPRTTKLYPRNIADDTSCISQLFEEDGATFVLYRVDFRAGNVLGSVGVVWRRPYGTPLEALRLAQRQAERIRAALTTAEARAAGTIMAARAALVPERVGVLSG
jgi:hypothetical protein